MTKQEGLGVEVMLRLVDSLCRQAGEASARSLIDGLEDVELAAVAQAISSATRATTGEPCIIIESLAARVAGRDVATHGSCCGHPMMVDGEALACVRAPGHELPHSIFRFESDNALEGALHGEEN